MSAPTPSIGMQLVAKMCELTWDRHGPMGVANAKRNLAFRDRGKSLAALRREEIGEGDTAVVIAAGPSLKRQDPAKALLSSGYKGAVITTESALLYCLRQGLVPDLTVTLDPHATRIVRWFGDPHLSPDSLKADDYFSRQDMDRAFADEMAANREILALLDQYGPRIRIALSTSASEAVVNRVLESGMQIYWWNPMFDDPDMEGSISADLQAMNRFPCVNAGGNVGSAAWMMAGEVLGKSKVALTGVDFSYYDDTPYKNTQYYKEALSLVGEENLEQVYIRLFNPHVGAWFYTDPAYMWYRESFLEMARDADFMTYNCTSGGILFGDPIRVCALETFLNEHAP
ncbi:conserved hypothetical protein [Rhodospirillaceae bacterium LM-1]|nr:conserved hypothetical protein [Rhodospirillaceae bacterium LM-1]